MPASYTRSLSELTQRARSGDPDAQFHVGDAWDRLLGVDELALYWFRRAADGGATEAYPRLVELFSRKGLRYDPREALFWCVTGMLAGSRASAALLPGALRVLGIEDRALVLRRVVKRRIAAIRARSAR